MENILKQIIEFVDHSHGEQTRRYSPDRYIVHPVRVMETVKKYSDSIVMPAAAVLHDVLEDTPVTAEEIRDFLKTIVIDDESEKILNIVIELTDVFIKKDFPHMNRRTRKSRELERLKKISVEAQTIKYADIMDNTSEILTDDPEFAAVYLYECRTILTKLTGGNKELREEALSLVNSYIGLLKKDRP